MIKKKRNPQDTTLRNISSLKRRVDSLEELMRHICDIVDYKRNLKKVKK